MPAVIKKSGTQWCVYSHAGEGARRLGCHTTRAKALAQQRAVNASLSRKGKI